MKTSVKFKFRPSIVKGKPGSLYVQFIKGRKSRSVVIKNCRVYPNEWDELEENVCLMTRKPGRVAYLEKMYERVQFSKKRLMDLIYKLDNHYEDYTIEDLLLEYEQRYNNNGLVSYIERLASKVEPKHPRTARSYRSVGSKIMDLYGRDVAMDKITAAFIQQFEKDILAQGRKLNTSSYYLRNLRAILNKAMNDKVIDSYRDQLFSGVFTGNERTEKRAVKEDVIEALETLEISDSHDDYLILARDTFLLSYYLRGMSFIDLVHLKPDNIRDGCIFYIRHKTGQHLEVEITKEIQTIIDRYRTLDGDYVLPFLCNGDSSSDYAAALRQENNCLRKLSSMIGLDKPITTYVARHSWASIALAKGVSIDLISQGLGHDNIRTTMIYLKSFDYSNLHAANRKIISRGNKAA